MLHVLLVILVVVENSLLPIMGQKMYVFSKTYYQD